ncbi:MAG: GNAT family N-acetyltransferase [Clostridia bacterium]|nr:GNAT family N-acetyltransferase [Clostridia bacterium]
MNVYENCPHFIGPRLTLRPVRDSDAQALLAVYSDPQAQPYFNADNCTCDFRYTTLEQMQDCIAMWRWSYAQGHFVRWTICSEKLPIGTVELFRRTSEQDIYDNCALLRIDLRSIFEMEEIVFELLELLVPRAMELFGCTCMATKVPPFAAERMLALARKGFVPSDAPLIGHGGSFYGDYWLLRA